MSDQPVLWADGKDRFFTVWHSPNETVPPEGRYVLVELNAGWWDQLDNLGARYRVVKRWVHDGTTVYSEFGPGQWNEVEVRRWCEIPGRT